MKKKKKTGSIWLKIIGAILVLIIIVAIHYMDKHQQEGSIKFYPFTKQGELTFQKGNGSPIKTIDIEIADTINKTVLGLMFRNKMPETQGMLFIFENEEPRSFWMKDTYISLDIVFVDSSNKIVSIAENTIPFSTDGYESTEPAQYVVETVAGFTRKYDIKPGDLIEWKRISAHGQN